MTDDQTLLVIAFVVGLAIGTCIATLQPLRYVRCLYLSWPRPRGSKRATTCEQCANTK